MEKRNKRLLVLVSILLVGVSVSLAYFATKILSDGEGSTNKGTTANIKGATLKVEGILEFEDLNVYPGHKTISNIKVTATGNNELIPYNLIWNGTNTITTTLNYTIYKTSELVDVDSTCKKVTKVVNGSQQLSEECSISNIDKLGTEVASGTINKNDTKIELVSDEFITASPTGQVVYYYVVLEYPNLDISQNEDLNGTLEGKITVEESNIKPDINIIAAYVIQDDGTYKEQDDIPQEGYQLNTSKSTCSNGTIPNWDPKTHTFSTSNLTKSGTSCYLYFDKYVPPIEMDNIIANLDKTASSSAPTFSQVAESDEGVFKTSDGMYGGTTYYWRGAATTNHVIFANKCWRIVRINGDKTMRLIYNGDVQSGNTCTGNGANAGAVIMGSTNAEKYYATSDGQYNNSSYVGWTYTLSTQRTLSGTSSNAKTQTEKWYSSNITGTNAEKVADGKFCNDRNTGTPPSSWGSGYTTTWSATGTKFAYAGPKRLYEDYNPTFACNSGDTYTLKVGAITADEVEFAGGKNENHTSYYLYTGQHYWTMSPYYWGGSNAHVFYVASNGYLNFSNVNNSNIGLRPVINLRSDITFSSGNGEQNSPCVVEN